MPSAGRRGEELVGHGGAEHVFSVEMATTEDQQTIGEMFRKSVAPDEGMTRTELMHHFGRHQSSEQIGRALSVLARGNFVTSTTEKTAGRPAERWRDSR